MKGRRPFLDRAGLPDSTADKFQLNIYVSKDMRDEVKAVATAEGVSVSTYARTALVEAMRRSRDRKRKRVS
jgi:post-segregation antitoxin (ccd killing protein)